MVAPKTRTGVGFRFFIATVTSVQATGTLTLTGQPLNTETVTIGTRVYTFQTTLTDTDGNVAIGASVAESIQNLVAAINLGAGSGTRYAASTTANTDVTASIGASDTSLTLTAITGGITGNAIATTETLTNGSFGGTTLAGGSGAMPTVPAPQDVTCPSTIPEFEALTYTEVEPVDNIGVFGNVTEVVNFIPLKTGNTLKSAGGSDAGNVTVRVARDINQNGQTAMLAAQAGRTLYAFLVMANDRPSTGIQNTLNYFVGVVTGVPQTVGDVNTTNTIEFTVAISDRILTDNAE